MKNTQLEVKDIFGDVISKDSNLTDQIFELKIFFSQNDVNININIKTNFSKSRKKKNRAIQPSAPPGYNF